MASDPAGPTPDVTPEQRADEFARLAFVMVRDDVAHYFEKFIRDAEAPLRAEVKDLKEIITTLRAGAKRLADLCVCGPLKARVAELEAERDALRQQVEGHCNRIAAQSELLSRAARRREVSDPERVERIRIGIPWSTMSESTRRDVEFLLAEIDSLRMPPPAPAYTSTPPTTPGHYWWRHGGQALMVCVRDPDAVYVPPFPPALATDALPDGGLWCGPLVPPPAPEGTK